MFQRSQLLLSAGGDVLAKYGTWTRRLGSQVRGGEGLAESFTRAGTALALQSDGYYLNAQANCPRVEWSIDPVTGLLRPYLLIEGLGSTNLLLHNQSIGGTSWARNALAAPASGVATDPLRGTNYAPIVPDGLTNTNRHGVTQAVTIAGASDNLDLTLWAARRSSADYQALRLYCTDGGGSNGFCVVVNLLTGVAIATAAFGTGTVAGEAVASIGGGTRIQVWGAIGTGTTAVFEPVIYDTVADATNDTAYTGDGTHGVVLWGAQLEDGGNYPPSSVITTAGASASRGAELLSIPLNGSPRPLAIYIKFLELGGNHGNNFANLWQLGPISATPPAEFLLLRLVSSLYNVDHGRPQGTEVVSAGTISPTLGQQAEVLALLFPDGSVQIIESLQNATEIAGTRSAANAIGPVWGNAPTLTIAPTYQALGLISLKVIDNTPQNILTIAGPNGARAVAV